jgi:multidrug efflux pump subunit AcrA (membrane-fusion protein)
MKGIMVIIAVSLGAALAAACSKKQEAAEEKAPMVKGAKVETVKLSPVDDYYEAVGTVRSQTTSVLSAKIVGSVIAMRVREGDRVRVGQALAEIDNRDARAQAQKAEAGLREAQDAAQEIERTIRAAESARTAAEANQALAAATFNRYQALLARRSVSPQEFDEAQAKYRVAEAEAERADRLLQSLGARKDQVRAKIAQAQAEVANAQVALSYTRITSPINGVVTAKQAEVGYTATPGAPLLTVEDHRHYRLEVAAEESQVGKIRLKQPVRVRIAALGQGEIAGSVAEVAPAADPASRSCTVKIEIPLRAAPPRLRSGLYGTARFITGQRQVLTIPTKAVIHRGQLTGAYAVDEAGAARLRLIQTGKSYGDRVEVLSGLSEGERIVVDGAANLSEGSRVQSSIF